MKYRKKPIEVEAFRFGHDRLPKWANHDYSPLESCNQIIYLDNNEFCYETTIATTIRHGDWCVKMTKDSGMIFMECVPHDKFIETYEAVE